jgi:GNAT superfamily N-acetyltransferase
VLTDSVASGYLGDVLVLPEWRGRGISRLLMLDDAHKWMQRRSR